MGQEMVHRPSFRTAIALPSLGEGRRRRRRSIGRITARSTVTWGLLARVIRLDRCIVCRSGRGGR
eukprot:10385751-Alexandrium_andersonii.AAC.1